MKIFRTTDFSKFDSIYKLHFFNSLTGFKSANLIGSKSKDGIPNIAVFSSVTHLGSDPPVVGFFTRPGENPSDTYRNILDTKSYTINHISNTLTSKAHQTSANYSPTQSEFSEVGFEEEYTNTVYAPYIKDCIIKLGMEYRDHYSISTNGTVLIVGEIVEIKLPESIIENDGHINLNKAGTVAISGLDAYHKATLIERYGYAEADQET